MDTSFTTESQPVRLISTLPPDRDDPSCDIYREWRRRSKGFIIRGYEGIPQNPIFNIIGVCIMVILFSFLRKKAWNYGRIALLNDVGWATLFYRSSKDQLKSRISTESQDNASKIDDSGYFSWIKVTYTLTDEDFLAKSGADAVQYLKYQRHLIFLASIITMASLIIVLPLNLQGTRDMNREPDFGVFEQSTIFNLGSDSKLLWIHEILALVFLFLSIFLMRHFSREMKFVSDDTTSSRTVMVAGIAKKYCKENRVRRHFLEKHPGFRISESNLAYDVSKLVQLEEEKAGVVSSRKYWEEHILAQPNYRPIMRPYTCGNICCCCFCCMKTTDALEYYANLEYKLRQLSEKERKRAYGKALGIAFLTFATVAQAETIVKEYRLSARVLMQIPVTRYSRRLKSRNWVVSLAPLPEDLYWENLSLGYRAWYFKAIVVNLTLVIIVLFYSTPVFLLNALSVYLEIQKFIGSGIPSNTTTVHADSNSTDPDSAPSTVEGILRDTVPTFLLWLAAVTLPSLVSLTDRFIGFWTKTSENRSKMIKTFTFLLFMVIILPSLGLTSASSIFLRDKPPQWKCIFSPSNGSFFVNYMITSCFLGTMSELMRLPELLIYGIKICFAKSVADIGAIRKSVLWDFQLGSQYAWMMLIFAIFILFSLVTPIITIFGFIYLIFKHYVDRYNIYFAYAPCNVDKAVHGTAINFVVVCTFLQQLILVAYTNSNVHPIVHDPPHQGHSQAVNKPLQAFTILGFCVTAALFIGQVFFNLCTNFSPIKYKTPKRRRRRDIEHLAAVDSSASTAQKPSSSFLDSDVANANQMVGRAEVPRRKVSMYDGGGSALDMIAGVGGQNRSSPPPAEIIPDTSSAARAPIAEPEPEPELVPELVPEPNYNHDFQFDEEPDSLLPSVSTLNSRTGVSIVSAEERILPIDVEYSTSLCRPGIDKPYGHFFPKILRLDYDYESAMDFTNMYFRDPDPSEEIEQPRPTSERRDEYIIQLHNDRKKAKTGLRSAVRLIPSSTKVSSSSDSSSGSSEAISEPPFIETTYEIEREEDRQLRQDTEDHYNHRVVEEQSEKAAAENGKPGVNAKVSQSVPSMTTRTSINPPSTRSSSRFSADI